MTNNRFGLYRYTPIKKRLVPMSDVLAWGKWLETAKRHVAESRFENPKGEEVWISTVFLGLDHNRTGQGRPVLFETIVFGGRFDQQSDRCCTWAEAELMHLAMVETLQEAKEIPTFDEFAKLAPEWMPA